MPNISIELPEVQQAVVRPSIIAVVDQIKEITGIPKDVMILFPGDIEKNYQPGSAISDKGEDRTQFMNNNLVEIEVDEDFYKESLMTTAITRPEHLPIFIDDNLDIFVKPIYITSTVTITFKYRTTSKTVADRWRNDIRMRLSSMRDINLHNISYHYLIPPTVVTILGELHRLRENVAPYGETFEQYLVDHSSTRITDVATLNGGRSGLAITETQSRIIGYFDFDTQPDKFQKDDNNGTVINTFTYKFNYEKPVECNIKYPIMVHNQVLQKRFIPQRPADNMANHNFSYSLSLRNLNYFESQLQLDKAININSSIKIPAFDDFVLNTRPHHTAPVFSALCQITDTDKRTLLNLRELGDIVLDKDILDYIQVIDKQFITKLLASFINISFYRNGNLVEETAITVDNNLNVLATSDLDIRNVHHVVFSIFCDSDWLNDNVIARLKNYPKAFVKLLISMSEKLRNNPTFIDLYKRNNITQSEIEYFVKNPSMRFNDTINNISMKTVMLSSVVAYRK